MEVAVTSRDDVSQKLDALVKAMTDLSQCVKATEEYREEGVASLTSSPSTSRPKKRARTQETPVQTQDVAEKVWQWVAKRLRELPAYYEATTEEDYTSEEEE